MMTADEILALARLYAEHKGITLHTAGVHAAKNSEVFMRLSRGKGANTKTIARAADWFAQNWPADLRWPDDIRRPAQQAA